MAASTSPQPTAPSVTSRRTSNANITMASPLFEVLTPYLDPSSPAPSPRDGTTTAYLTRLSTLSLASLTTTEPQTLSQTSHTLHLSLQALSARSYASIIDS